MVFRFELKAPQEQLPLISIDDLRILEGDEGFGEANFTVSLSSASISPITIDFETLEGTAAAGKDFTRLKGQLVFNPGERKKALSVQLIWDEEDEEDETLFVALSNASYGVLGKNEGVAVIEDNDSPPATLLGQILSKKFIDLNSNGVQDAIPGLTSVELINNSSAGYYNNQIGDLYPGDPQDPLAHFFRGPNVSTGDPALSYPDEPDLGFIEPLGDWLSNPETATLNDFWTSLQSVPSTWDVNTETAIIYEIDGGEYGISNVLGSFGADNGMFAWVNGDYKFGAIAGGTAIPGEYQVDLGDFRPGKNYVQIIRADHGGSTGFDVDISGIPNLGFESSFPGVTIYLDSNNNAALDTDELFQVTSSDDPSTSDVDETGQYHFTDLLPGEYIVREVVPPEYEQTFPESGFHTALVEAGQIVKDLNFGNALTSPPPVNFPPGFTSIAPTIAQAGKILRYEAVATDPDNDALSYELLTNPEGMTVDSATGVVLWQPSLEQIGQAFDVTLRVQDGWGGIADQSFQISVAASNTAPTITSTPSGPSTVVVGNQFEYDVEAIDPNGDVLTYELVTPPVGMVIDPVTGLVQWTPTPEQQGAIPIQISVSDPFGGVATQEFTLTVRGNSAPTFTSQPVVEVIAGAPYRYDLAATDPDTDSFTFSLVAGPEGLVIDSAGRLTWSPAIANIGTVDVEVAATDSFNATSTQTFQLTVLADQIAPQITLLLGKEIGNIGENVVVQVLATDNIGVQSRTLLVNDVPVILDAEGRATLPLTQIGPIDLVATAVDAAGNIGNITGQILVRDPNDTEAPIVEFSSLINGTVFTAPGDLIGTASDANLLYYSLSIAPIAGGAFTEILRGTNSVFDSVLGEFDPTLLQNDTYVLQLFAIDQGGLTASTTTEVNIAGDLKLGNFQLSFTDLSIPVSGIPIQVTRTYDTLTSNTRDDFGFGWRMEFRDTDLRTSLAPTGAEEDGIYAPFKDGTRVYITAPGGKREGFTFQPREIPRINGFVAEFIPDPGVTSRLSIPSNITLRKSGNEYFLFGSSLAFNPADSGVNFSGQYTLTSKEGIVYQIDSETGDLDTITDRNNNTLTFTDSSITSSTGQRITFERDAQSRITGVIDPEGNRISYAYDALGDLISVTDREGNTTQYDYNDDRAHYLEDITDPLGRTGIRSEYDDQGRLKRMIDANGNPVELIFDPNNDTQQVRDQYGNLTTYVYDQRGNVLTEINAESEVTERTYDDDNNVKTETIILEDGTRLTTAFTYNANGDVLAETDPLNKVTRYTYDNFGNILTTIDPTEQTVTNTYDTKGNLTKLEGQASGTLSFGYDAAGNLKEMEDGAGATTFEYDTAGNLIKQTDANGKVTNYTYDKNGNRKTETTTYTLADGTQRTLLTQMEYDNEGRATKVTDAEGGVTETQYDDAGNRIWEKNARGYVTEYRYDDRGQLIETIHPDETPTTNADNPRTIDLYDVGGRLRASIDEEGFATHFVYDKAGRQIAIIYPKEGDTLAQLISAIAPGQTPATIDWTQVVYPNETPAFLAPNPRTRTEYDAAGRAVAEIDERLNRTEFRYDNAGRLRETVLPDDTPADPNDNPRSSSTYDDAGRQLTQTDALRQTTEFLYDSLGRPEGQEYADGTRTRVEYDAAGRVKARIDQEGKTTQFEYDPLGRLKTVIDARNQRTEYTYDPQGNLIQQEDAEEQVTRYGYDNLGRREATVLPLGQSSTSEYDLVGNLESTIDFNGAETEYTYDARNRLVFKDLPGSEFDVAYTYTPDSQLKTVTDGQGTTTYRYDARDRLLERIDPDGRIIKPYRKLSS